MTSIYPLSVVLTFHGYQEQVTLGALSKGNRVVRKYGELASVRCEPHSFGGKVIFRQINNRTNKRLGLLCIILQLQVPEPSGLCQDDRATQI